MKRPVCLEDDVRLPRDVETRSLRVRKHGGRPVRWVGSLRELYRVPGAAIGQVPLLSGRHEAERQEQESCDYLY